MHPSDPFVEFNSGDKTVIRPSPRGRRRFAPKRSAIRVGNFADEANVQPVDFDGDNPLISGAFSLLSLVPKLRSMPFHDAVNSFQERLVEEIKKFENSALEKSNPKSQVDIAKYFLCALLDETILNTPWGSQSGWGHNSLSSLFYKKLVAGEEFFQILNQIKSHAVKNKNLLEFAYLCLSFGFKGKFRYMNNGLLSLEQERQELYLILQRIKGSAKPELAIHWQGFNNKQNPIVQHVPLWVLGGIVGVLLLIIYMAFAFSIRVQSDQLYGELITIGHRIAKIQPEQFALLPKEQAEQLAPSLQEISRPPLLEARLKQVLSTEAARNEVAVIDGPALRIFNMFKSGSAEVRKEYHTTLSKIAQMLKTEKVHVTIVGHTDNQQIKFSSRFKSNWHLSVARAENTMAMLSQYGLRQDRMRFEGMADKDPIAPNKTEAGRAMNRRIDILISGEL